MNDDRIKRALKQKIFLVDTINVSTYHKIFTILGSTGNIYTVHFKNTPTCNCPDFLKNNKHCKHIYFILIRLMKCTDIKDKYTRNELIMMFQNSTKIDNSIVIDNITKEKYIQQQNNYEKLVQQKPINKEDICPICLDNLGDEKLIYCKKLCGNNIHKLCYEQLSYFNKKYNKNMICPYCRTNWDIVQYININ